MSELTSGPNQIPSPKETIKAYAKDLAFYVQQEEYDTATERAIMNLSEIVETNQPMLHPDYRDQIVFTALTVSRLSEPGSKQWQYGLRVAPLMTMCVDRGINILDTHGPEYFQSALSLAVHHEDRHKQCAHLGKDCVDGEKSNDTCPSRLVLELSKQVLDPVLKIRYLSNREKDRHTVAHCQIVINAWRRGLISERIGGLLTASEADKIIKTSAEYAHASVDEFIAQFS